MMVSEFMDRLVWREIVPFLKLTASLHLKLDGWMVENHHSYTPKNLAANKPLKDWNLEDSPFLFGAI